MNAPEMHIAALAHHDRAEAYRESKYREMLDEAFERVATNDAELEKFDRATDALFFQTGLIATILRAYCKGESLLRHVDALHDALHQSFEDWKGEEIRERAEAAILAGGDDD